MSIRAFNLLHSGQAGVVDVSGILVSYDFESMPALPDSISVSGNAGLVVGRGLFVGAPDGLATESLVRSVDGCSVEMSCEWDAIPAEVLAMLEITGVPGGFANRVQITRDARAGNKYIRVTISTDSTARVEIRYPYADSNLSASIKVNAFSGNTTLYVNGDKATTYHIGAEDTVYSFTANLAEMNYMRGVFIPPIDSFATYCVVRDRAV